jgi:hypothetical protein
VAGSSSGRRRASAVRGRDPPALRAAFSRRPRLLTWRGSE